MNTQINHYDEPVVKYGLYTEALAPIVLGLASKIEGIDAEIVTLNSEEDIQIATIAWSEQLEASFTQRESRLPEFARRKELPNLYTVNYLRETLGRTVHTMLKVSTPKDEDIAKLTIEALNLAI